MGWVVWHRNNPQCVLYLYSARGLLQPNHTTRKHIQEHDFLLAFCKAENETCLANKSFRVHPDRFLTQFHPRGIANLVLRVAAGDGWVTFFISLWSKVGFCFIQSDFSLSRDNLVNATSGLKRRRGANSSAFQRMWLFDHFLRGGKREGCNISTFIVLDRNE